MALRDDIQRAQIEAMKEKDSAKRETLRLLWSVIRTEEINKRAELDDAGTIAVISRQMKQLEDALKDFTAAGRSDLIAKANAEKQILSAYLPSQLSDEDLKNVVERVIGSFGAATMADSGKIMGAVMKEVKGVADGNRVRDMVSKILKGP